jgi:colicin import membrane protein
MFFHALPGEWKWPLNLAVGIHLLALLAALFLPQLLHKRPVLPEITTIDLVSMGEPSASKEPAAPPAPKAAPRQAEKPVAKEEAAPPAPTPPPPPPKAPEIIKQEVIKQTPALVEKPVPTPEPVVKAEPAPPPAPIEAISLKPLKQKIKKEVKEIPDKKVEETKVRKEELKNIAQQLQEEAKNEAKKEAAAQETIKQQRQLAAAREQAREQARRADLEARLAIAEAERAAAAARDARSDQRSSSKNPAAGANTGSPQTMGIVNLQYYATITGHIKQYWQPPDVKSWDPNLLAIVSITVSRNGQIISKSFEKESGDKLFDQFVLKTLEAANPLPAFPPALQEQRLEIGLKFKPSGIQ